MINLKNIYVAASKGGLLLPPLSISNWVELTGEVES
jgi:hypothetical protein